MSLAKPDMTVGWASTGAQTVPLYTQIQQGWVEEYPTYQFFNWLDGRQDSYLQHINQMGIPQWDAGTSYVPNGSYTNRNGTIYVCVSATTGNDPATDTAGTYWQVAFTPYAGQLLRLLGSAVTPTYSFTGYGGTGLYATPSSVNISVNGTNVATINSIGNIATSSLTLSGAASVAGNATIGGTATTNGYMFAAAPTNGLLYNAGVNTIDFVFSGSTVAYVDSTGKVSGASLYSSSTITAVGAISGASGAFSGGISGTWLGISGSISGNSVFANTGSFSGDVTAPNLSSNSSVHSVTGSRALGISYTNTSSKLLFLNVTVLAGSPASFGIFIDGATVCDMSVAGLFSGSLFAVVPPGATYQATAPGSTLTIWTETY